MKGKHLIILPALVPSNPKKKKIIRWIGLLFFALVFVDVVAQEQLQVRFLGLKIFVDDLERAEDFYQGILGFEVLTKNKNQISLVTNTWPIYLEKTLNNQGSNYPHEARTGLAIQTGG